MIRAWIKAFIGRVKFNKLNWKALLGEDRIPVVSSRFQDRWKSSGFKSNWDKCLSCHQMCPHCTTLNSKEEITVWILEVQRAVVNSVVLWLQVLSDSFESPSGTLEVYRQTDRYHCNRGPCDVCYVHRQGTWPEFLMWFWVQVLVAANDWRTLTSDVRFGYKRTLRQHLSMSYSSSQRLGKNH